MEEQFNSDPRADAEERREYLFRIGLFIISLLMLAAFAYGGYFIASHVQQIDANPCDYCEKATGKSCISIPTYEKSELPWNEPRNT